MDWKTQTKKHLSQLERIDWFDEVNTQGFQNLGNATMIEIEC